MPLRETIANWLIGRDLQEIGAKAEDLTRFARVAEAYDLTLADIELALEDVGWMRLGRAGADQTDMMPQERQNLVRRSRVYAQQDPLVAQAMRLYTDYAFARPWTFRSSEDEVQELMQTILEMPANRRTIGTLEAQRKQARRLLVDGERFLVCFIGDSESPVTVRGVDCLQIENVITDPEDAENVLGYHRRWATAAGEDRSQWYADWDADEERIEQLREIAARSNPAGEIEDPDEVRMSQLAVNTIGQRGLPLASSGLNWSQAHRRFMEDRATITRARAALHAKRKLKGGAASVLAARNAIATSDPSRMSDPPPIAGSTIIENEADTLEPVRWPMDAKAAAEDALQLKLLFCAASGIAEPFFGSAADSNLATAKTLLRPMELEFSAFQLLWASWMEDLIMHAAAWQEIEADRSQIDIDAPPIVEQDVAVMGAALAQLAAVYPAIVNVEEVLQYILTIIGINNVDAIMERLAGEPPETPGAEALREALSGALWQLRGTLEGNGRTVAASG